MTQRISNLERALEEERKRGYGGTDA
jgi:hypothetical protein